MAISGRFWSRVVATAGLVVLLSITAGITAGWNGARAGSWFGWRQGRECGAAACAGEGGPVAGEMGGSWYWLRSPEEEKRAVMSLFNRYCIRCHGVDGRGVWDIPGVPNFTNLRWQESRSDAQLSRIILEGRGAVMPPFRGTLSLEESWAMARYLRTFVPGTEVTRPDLGPSAAPQPEKSKAQPEAVPAPQKSQE